MNRCRRSFYLLVTLETFENDADSTDGSASLVLTAVLTGQHLVVTGADLEQLCQISCTEWSDLQLLLNRGFERGKLECWIALGVLLSDHPSHLAIIQIEDNLKASHWPPCAATFHLLNHYHESQVASSAAVTDTFLREQDADKLARKFLAKHGPPPPTFARRPDVLAEKDLSLEILDSSVTRALLGRRTTRYFDRESQLSNANLSHLLRLVFGVWATRTLAGQLELVLKTSPSGGSLHPLEGFLLALRVEDLDGGLYHYQPASHRLELLREVEESEGRRLAVHFAQGQTFVGECALLVILVARFDRNFWKYRERENSYSVVLQDAGHLSQTFQIVATDLGLGSFYTAAINTAALVQFLSLRYPAEAPIGLLGIGTGKPDPELPVEIKPFEPIR